MSIAREHLKTTLKPALNINRSSKRWVCFHNGFRGGPWYASGVGVLAARCHRRHVGDVGLRVYPGRQDLTLLANTRAL